MLAEHEEFHYSTEGEVADDYARRSASSEAEASRQKIEEALSKGLVVVVYEMWLSTSLDYYIPGYDDFCEAYFLRADAQKYVDDCYAEEARAEAKCGAHDHPIKYRILMPKEMVR